MKLKGIFAAMLLVVAGVQTAAAQGFRVYKSDGTIMQFSLRTDSIVFYDGIGSDQDFGPFTPVNQCIVGTWYKSRNETVTFREDGTTDYISGATYKFLPYQGTIVINNASGMPMSILKVHDVTAGQIIVSTLGSETFSVWSAEQPAQLVSSITVSPSSLSLQPNETSTLTATVLPFDDDNKEVEWTSSDEAVAEVSADGCITAKAEGTCVITCAAKDGSGVKGECEVTVQEANEQIITLNGVTFKMKKVSGGTFTMGATSEQSNGYTPGSDEKPTHLVTLSDYWMGETEVTQALWYAVMGAKPTSSNSWSTDYGLGDNYPAYYVSWNDCQTFITKLNQMTGKTFRLPTEAEWEFAARGGTKSQGYIFSGSNTIGDVAWYTVNSCDMGKSSPDYGTHPVKGKAANDLGLYDMSGNVWEWCNDWFGSYDSGSQTNPTGPTSGSFRVYRGGGWGSRATNCRVAHRSNVFPEHAGSSLGLRLAQ